MQVSRDPVPITEHGESPQIVRIAFMIESKRNVVGEGAHEIKLEIGKLGRRSPEHERAERTVADPEPDLGDRLSDETERRDGEQLRTGWCSRMLRRTVW